MRSIGAAGPAVAGIDDTPAPAGGAKPALARTTGQKTSYAGPARAYL